MESANFAAEYQRGQKTVKCSDWILIIFLKLNERVERWRFWAMFAVVLFAISLIARADGYRYSLNLFFWRMQNSLKCPQIKFPFSALELRRLFARLWNPGMDKLRDPSKKSHTAFRWKDNQLTVSWFTNTCTADFKGLRRPKLFVDRVQIPQVSKSELALGEEVEVTLKGTGFLTMEPFMGFLIQVQPPSNMNPCCSIVTVVLFAGTRC